MMSDNWSEIKWDAYSSGHVKGILLGNSWRWICQENFIFLIPKSIQFFLHTYFFFYLKNFKKKISFIGEMYVVDTTWFPNSSMQENMGRESSPSHLLKVHGPLGKSSNFYPSVCHGGCFWPCCSSPHAFWRNIDSRIPCQVLAGDSLLCWQEPGAKGPITISLNLLVYPPDVFLLH